MSIEFLVYTRSLSVVPREKVVEILATGGWMVRFVDHHHALSTTQGLEDGLVLGCHRDSVAARELERTTGQFDYERLQPFYDREQLGSTGLCVHSPYSFSEGLPEDEMEELREQIEAWALEELLQAKQQFTLRTSAGRSLLSVELQFLVAVSIALVFGGVFEDPMNGVFRQFEPGSDLMTLSL